MADINFFGKAMKENLLKGAQVAGLLVIAVMLSIAILILILSIDTRPEERAAFSAWESAQTYSKVHGATQSSEVTP